MLEKKDFKRELKNIKYFFNNIWKKIKNIISSNKFQKFFAYTILITTSIIFLKETILLLLIIGDLGHFAKIVQYFIHINIFEYLEQERFICLILGGYLMDVAVWGFLIYWSLKMLNKNITKKMKQKNMLLILFSFFIIGALVFSVNFWKAMPNILIPFQEHEYKEYREVKYNNKSFNGKYNNWDIVEEKVLGGYIIRGKNYEDPYNYSNFEIENKVLGQKESEREIEQIVKEQERIEREINARINSMQEEFNRIFYRNI